MRRALASAIAGLLITGALFVSFALAQDEPKTTPVILSPTNGAVVTSPVTVIVGFKDASGVMHDEATKSATNSAMGQMGTMHGDERRHGAHPHLIVDSPLPKAGTTVPMDAKHIHLMHGETKSVLNLKPGKHTLRLIMGDENHVIRVDAPAAPQLCRCTHEVALADLDAALPDDVVGGGGVKPEVWQAVADQ
jgi:hypothetical protein